MTAAISKFRPIAGCDHKGGDQYWCDECAYPKRDLTKSFHSMIFEGEPKVPDDG